MYISRYTNITNSYTIPVLYKIIYGKQSSDYQKQGYWHQRAYERYGNPPQDNQELLMVRDKVGRLPGELGGKQMHRM